MKKALLVLLCIVISAGFLGFGCAKKPAAEGEPIVIGAILRLSLGASDGLPAKRGIEFAVEEINNAGGINGRPLEVIFEDCKDNETDAVNAANKLISVDVVPVIIGPMMSGTALAVAPIAEENGIVMITPTATSPKVTDAGTFVYRGCTRIDKQSEALVKYISEKLGVKTAAILYSNEPYGKGFNDLLKKFMPDYGITVVAEESFMRGDREFKSQLTKIAATTFDILCTPGYLQETAPAIFQAREMGITVPSLGGFGDMAPLYIELAGAASEGHIITSEYDEQYNTKKNKEFVKKYYDFVSKTPNEPNNIMFAAITYDLTYIIADAITAVGSDPVAIKGYLDTLEEFDGVTGKLSFDENGDVVKGAVYILEVKDGKYVKVN